MSCPVIIFITLILFIIIKNISEDILSLKLSRKAFCVSWHPLPRMRVQRRWWRPRVCTSWLMFLRGLMQCLLPLLKEEKKKKKKREASLPKAGKNSFWDLRNGAEVLFIKKLIPLKFHVGRSQARHRRSWSH